MSESQISADRPLTVSTYDSSYRQFLDRAFSGFAKDHQLLGDIVVVRDRHAGPIRNVREGVPLDQGMMEASATMTLERAALLATDVDAHTLMLAEFAEEMIGAQLTGFFKNMGEMCDAAGTTVKNDGQGIPTIEQAREMLAKVELAFDEDGKLQQTLVVHPSQAERAKKFNEQMARDPECARIVAEKRQKWVELRAARSRRTLSR